MHGPEDRYGQTDVIETHDGFTPQDPREAVVGLTRLGDMTTHELSAGSAPCT